MAVLAGNGGSLRIVAVATAEVESWTLNINGGLKESHSLGDSWGETTQTVLVNDLLEVFRFGIEKDFNVENVTLDKNDKILKKISSEEFTAANYLNQNFPNPFNANTVIPLSITEGGYYELKIFNVQGSLIKTLARGVFGRGNYRYAWDGTNEEGEKVASGIYFYKLKGKTFSLSKKMLYLR